MTDAFRHSHQFTLAYPVKLSGIGLHSGLQVQMTIEPAAAHSGIVFVRSDVAKEKARIAASCQLVTDTRLGTTLTNSYGVSLSTVEHLMAAFWGLGVDNARVIIDAAEVPVMDGSSQPFIEAIRTVGLKQQSALRSYIKIIKPLEQQIGESTLSIAPADQFSVDIDIEYNHRSIARQTAFYDFEEDDFETALAEARTFGFLTEVEQLKKIGLARGGSLDNAIVLSEDAVLNAEGLRSTDEFVRHKALDCVGDLFLVGHRLIGAVKANKPGHTINNALARMIISRPDAWTLVSAAPLLKNKAIVSPFRAAADLQLA